MHLVPAPSKRNAVLELSSPPHHDLLSFPRFSIAPNVNPRAQALLRSKLIRFLSCREARRHIGQEGHLVSLRESRLNNVLCRFDLNITRWYASRNAALFNFCPSIPGVFFYQHKTLTLGHAVFSIALCGVVVHSNNVFQLLSTSARRNGRALLLNRWAGSTNRGARVGVRRCGSVIE
jgi:hypothetical protein